MSLSISYDSGKTWEKSILVSDKATAYSDLLVLPNGDVAIFYERGENRPYDTMVFTIVPKKELKR